VNAALRLLERTGLMAADLAPAGSPADVYVRDIPEALLDRLSAKEQRLLADVLQRAG
jgi:hypothetical protein